MPFDYTDAPPPSFDLIPDGMTATLDLEFTVLDGPYKTRKFWHNLLLTGTTDGQKKMAAGNLGVLKAILDSALGLMPPAT
jgi:hypothetical protein